MSYKDEYEVARLYTDPAFRAALADQFAGDPKLRVNLASPLISWRKDAKTGRPRKVAVPEWLAFPMFRMLAGLKGLRGTALDLPGYQAERRMERALIGEYKALIREAATKVTSASLHTAVEIAASADLVAGYGPVKEAGVEQYRARISELMPKLAESLENEPQRSPEPTTI
jgi:indolepyruvate ferredoxin oxidoreductase